MTHAKHTGRPSDPTIAFMATVRGYRCLLLACLLYGFLKQVSEASPRLAAAHPEKDGGTLHSQIARLSILRSSATAEDGR